MASVNIPSTTNPVESPEQTTNTQASTVGSGSKAQQLKNRYCSWKFCKPILISLGILLASLTTLGLIIVSGVPLGLGVGIVLGLQILLAIAAVVFIVKHFREFKANHVKIV
ncbi:hypothetical protein C10C_0278 [Chlamydia serpentis]|uniref:Uncharacterized protein n=1 Tax=Chlamydia serpentis TaxID=1967782 RepID=A0A2R8FAU3_9CHLA|nr:hypothetical protein [Chlamydia serpentis]SPN73452.1 hypothetical protein C10C_0278 [Chlamydia serpentis]